MRQNFHQILSLMDFDENFGAFAPAYTLIDNKMLIFSIAFAH